MNLEIGSTVGDYEVVGILGAGGMGKVYKVRNIISDRVEAMKVLLPDLVHEPDLADRFLREIKVQASLEHPNIASLHTAVRVDNQLLMLMELVEGTTLEQKTKNGPLPVAEAVDYMRQVLSALDYAHAHGVIHRDLKPANMMLTPSGVVKLMDFGIAKAATDRRLTMTGTTIGSLYYMSPEQIKGSAGLDPRSDLYSLGVSLYELVTGKHPFDGDSQYSIMAAHLEKEPVPPITVDPSLPSLLNDVILMSVLKDPNARFQTAAAFRNALGSLVVPVAAPSPAPGPAPAAKPMPGPIVGQVANPVANPVASQTPAPQPAQTAQPQSKRGLWMAMGAVAAALAVVGVIEFWPGKGTKAALGLTSSPPATTTQAPLPGPAATTQAAPPAVTEPQSSASAPPQSQPAQVVQPPNSQPAASSPAREYRRVAGRSEQPAMQTPVQSQPQQQAPAPRVEPPPPTQQPVQQPAQQPVQQPAVQQPRADDAATRAALQDVREQLIMLNARVTGIRGTLQRLEGAQGSSGLGMNAAIQEPAHLMNTYMDEANNALNAGDAASAKSFFDKAERQVEKLEKILHR